MGGPADPGLVLTARVLPCAVVLFSRYTGKELARHRRTLIGIARGAEVAVDEAEDSIIEGTQGLIGVAIMGTILSAAAVWLSQHAAYTAFSVLAAAGIGVLAFTGMLAAIYGARVLWRRPRLTPRRSDFWIAVGCGVLAGGLVLAARLAAR